MADDKAIPLPPNSRVHPEPHIALRGFIYVENAQVLHAKNKEYHVVVRREGPYIVGYYNPPIHNEADAYGGNRPKKYYDLTNCVATWIRHEESKTERSN